MKIKRVLIPTSTLQDFVESCNLTLLVEENFTPKVHNFTASLPLCDDEGRPMNGSDSTEIGAINRLAERISGRKLKLKLKNTFIQVPFLLEYAPCSQ